MIMKKQQDLIAESLRLYAERMCDNPDLFTTNEAKSLDRALRSCYGISDIDRVWVRWCYIGEPRGWITSDELVYKEGRVGYN